MKTRLVTWAGLLLSAALIGYLLYRFDLGAALAAVRMADKSWLVIATLLYVSLFVLRGYRWTVLLEPLKAVPVAETTKVFMIGVMANNVLPARLGDVARAFFLARKERIPASATFSNVLLERIFDGLAVVGLLNFVLWYAPPKDLWVHTVGWVMAAVFVGAVVFCTLIAFWEAQFLALAHRIAARLPQKATALVHLFEKLAKGLHTLKSPRRTIQVGVLSLVIWMLEAAVYALVQRAFGLAGAERFVGGLGRLTRFGFMDMDKGVQLGLQRGHPRQAGVHQIDRRKLASRQPGGQGVDRQCG